MYSPLRLNEITKHKNALFNSSYVSEITQLKKALMLIFVAQCHIARKAVFAMAIQVVDRQD